MCDNNEDTYEFIQHTRDIIDELFELLLEDLNVTQMDLYHHEMSGIKKKSKKSKKKKRNNSTFRK